MNEGPEIVRARLLLYWATVEHQRQWFASDGTERHIIKAAGNVLDANGVRRISDKYDVNRGILRDKHSPRDVGAEGVARLVNNALNNWPNTLVERARVCRKVARTAERRGYTRGCLASATSKLIWFARPAGWTMFDDLAATGLGVRRARSCDRMIEFYVTLEKRGFPQVVDSVQRKINQSELRYLWGERVVDKYLMLRGSPDERRGMIAQVCEAYLDIIPGDLAGQVRALADQIVEALGDNPLGCHEE